MKKVVTSNSDSGENSLRNDSTNTIQLAIKNNTRISLESDLPVVRKNTVITSTGHQIPELEPSTLKQIK